MLVTRPCAPAARLCARIQRHGGEAIVLPLLDIVPPNDPAALARALSNLAAVDLMVLISAHAVHGITESLRRHQLQIPHTVRVAAVGPKTANQCERAGIKVDFVPRRQINSEGLLAELSDFPLGGKNILIFRGQSGREWLKQALESRGARVRYVQSYRRQVADLPLKRVLARWRGKQIDLVMASSVAVVQALRQTLGARNHALFAQTTLLAYSQRVADYCRTAGVAADIVVAKQPTDEAAIEALLAWGARRRARR